jgi:hypothetical protein
MKKTTLLFFKYLIIFSTFGYSQNINDIFPNFDKDGMNSDILYNPSSISNINNLKNTTHDLYSFYQVYKSIAFSDFQQRLGSLENIKDIAKSELLSTNISLALIYSEYETFNDVAKNNQLVYKSTDNQYARIQSDLDVFEHHQILSAAALKPLQRGLEATFNLSSTLFFNTSDKTINLLEIDFGDNLGYREILLNEEYDVIYESEGEKEISFRITLSNGEVNEVVSVLKVIYSNEELNQKFNQNIIGFTSETTDPPNIESYGETPFKGWGEMEIFYSADNILDKPIFVIDGFDPLDSRNINSIYQALNYGSGNLGDIVRDNGYDVVVLNFPTYFREQDQQWVYGGADYIERNAMLLVELIKLINDQKVGDNENVVIGPSMGGLISRYALNYMESIGVDHETRLYISFDTPHAGANVPIGFQHMFNYLAYGLETWVGDFSVESLRPVVDGMLKSPAARQMLWDHFESHLSDGIAEFDNNNALPQPHPFFSIFYNGIDSVNSFEYPQNTRNVSIINGSGSLNPYFDNNGNPVNPGFQSLDAVMPDVSIGADAYLDSWYTPYINQTIPVSNVYIDAPWWCFCDIEAQALAQSHGHTDGVDSAPGGLFDTLSITSDFTDEDPIISQFTSQLATNYFTFIPAISGMDYFTNNWYEYMDNPDNTPFEAWSMPEQNEIHTQLTPANVEFALNEIFEGQEIGIISTDQDKKPAIVFVENGNGDVFNGKIYASSVRGASRGGNGNSNDAFGNPGDWSVDFVVSEKTPEQAAQQHGGFTESGHPLYTGGDGNWSLIHEGMGAIGWGSFAANAYNRSSGLGSVSLGFSTIAGPQVGAAGGIDGGNVGQFSAGWGSRAIGNISTATGFRNTASGTSTVALGNYNYATGDSSIALGKENWAEGASTIAIGFKNHAAGAGSVALGQESVAWGTTNFTAGYQNIAGDINAPVGTAGSATAIGHGTFASGRSSFSANKYTSATNQASASLGLGTTADNFGMLAVGVNNAAGIGDTSIDPNDYGGYYYADGEYTGTNPGVAFVVGNGDVNSSTGRAGDNPSNAFIVNYDGSATLSGELTVESDTRLKTNITTLGNTLSKLLLIDGKSYTMKSNEAIEKIGLLAQEVQKAFPELVKQAGDAEGTLSINYQGMIPVLINAIKQQQIELQRLRDKLKIR